MTSLFCTRMYFKADFIQIQIRLFDQITVSVSDNWNTVCIIAQILPITIIGCDCRVESVRRMNGKNSNFLLIRDGSVHHFMFFMNMCPAWCPPPLAHSERLLSGWGSSDWPSMVRWLVKLICLHPIMFFPKWWLHASLKFIASIDRSVQVNLTVR